MEQSWVVINGFKVIFNIGQMIDFDLEEYEYLMSENDRLENLFDKVENLFFGDDFLIQDFARIKRLKRFNIKYGVGMDVDDIAYGIKNGYIISLVEYRNLRIDKILE
jgi:hypothetical protein